MPFDYVSGMAPRQPIYFVNCFLVVCAILGLAALAAGAIGWWAALDRRGWSTLLGGIVGAATAVYAMVYSAIAEYGRFRPWLVVSHTLVLALAQVAYVVLFVFDRPEAIAMELTPLQSAVHDPQAPWVMYGASLAAAAAIAAAARGWRALMLR